MARREPPALLMVEEARHLLAQCVSLDEAKDIADKAQAVAIYYRARGASLEAQNDASEIRLRAERRLGQLLEELGIRPGRKNSAEPEGINPALGEIGITYRQSSMWKRIAGVSDADFEDRIATAKENSLELTTARVLAEARAVGERQAKPKVGALDVTDLKALARAVVEAHTPEEVEQFIRLLADLVSAPDAA